MKVKIYLWFSFLLSLLLIFGYLSLTFEIQQPWETFLKVLMSYDASEKAQVILLSRLSRVAVAIFAGASLSLGGLLMQLHYRNALADPSLMGVTDGSALAVVLLLAFVPESGMKGRIFASLLGSFVAYFLIRLALKKVENSNNPVALPLIGMILSMLLGSFTTLIASYFNLAQSMTSWYNSRLYRVDLVDVHYFLWPLCIAILLLFLFRKQLDVYRFPKETTISIGLNRKFYENMFLFLVVILTGVTVAIVGRIAFVGIIVPHMARLLFGNRYEQLILIVPLMGAGFVLVADYLSRWVNYPFETPVGVMFALIGVPVFLWLIRAGKEQSYEI